MRYADVEGPSRVEPSFAKIFATHHGPRTTQIGGLR